jgi:hypothetical protein
LPSHGVGVVTQEVGELEGLFDLLEEGFDRSTAAVKVGHALRAPLHVVGEEFHFALLAVDLHQGPYAAHEAGILLPAALVEKHHFVVGEDFWVGVFLVAAFDDAKTQVRFGAGDSRAVWLE